jgi:uncharacterized protein YigA (DUF484 family)
MTTRQAQNITVEEVDEQSLSHYLQQTPDFFERHPQLLTRLRLQHPRNGTTISLIERQVEVLREKHASLEEQMNELVRVARANDALAGKIHRFTADLVRTANADAALVLIEKSLREDFDTHYGTLILQQAPAGAARHAFVRTVAGDDANFRSFDSLFASGKPRCGQIRDTQREFLFASDALNIASVALVPLTELSMPGLLALGSVEKDRFHPGMSTEFLARMGSLIAAAISRS